jgi:predicted peroxiredoxin
VKFLVQVTCGPENPTKAALGVLIARTAAEEGHDVTLFLIGEAVGLVRPAVMAHLVGLGTGHLKEHFEALVGAEGRVFVSARSAGARGLADASEAGIPVEFALPAVLVRCTAEADRVLCY